MSSNIILASQDESQCNDERFVDDVDDICVCMYLIQMTASFGLLAGLKYMSVALSNARRLIAIMWKCLT